jgi:acyl transferase domain-containing protein
MLSDAIAAGDPIRAVIRESALNQDGKSETITSPSQAAQIELMRETYRRAGLDPNHTQYFEAHGTGKNSREKTTPCILTDVS